MYSFDKSYRILILLFSSLGCFSFLIEELKSINYEVDILQTPMKKGEEPAMPVVHMTSIFGQEYQCVLPPAEEEEVSEKVAYSEKNTDIRELLNPMHTGNCLLKAKDWWTYELCFGQYIKQFHVEDGQIIGQVLTLGLYESDYDWNNETEQDKFKHAKQRYHSQYYVNGTKCDLTGQPRVAEVRIFCEEDSGDYVHRVDEPGTCSYVIAVHTSRVCSHPQLKPLPSKKLHPIPCHPLLNEEQYSSYLQKLNEEKALADEKRSQWLNNQQERLKVLKNENFLQSETEEYKELKDFYKTLIEDYKNEYKLEDISDKKQDRDLDQSSKTPVKSKELKEDLEKSKYQNDENKETGKENLEERIYKGYEKELEKLKSLSSPLKYTQIKKYIEELYETIINGGDDDEDLEVTEDAPFLKVFKYLRKLDKAERDVTVKGDHDKDESVITEKSEELKESPEVTSSKLGIKNVKEDTNEMKAESSLNDEEEDKDDLKVRIRRLDQLQTSGKAYEIDQIQQKKLERAIKEKLGKYGVNTGGRRIEVKIIKAGNYDSHLTDEEASQFENMITALLTGEQEAIQEMERNKKLEENYKFTWNDDNEEEE